MAKTIGDGMVALAIALAVIGVAFCFFYLLPISARNYKSNYEICINHCPQTTFTHTFTDLECPRLCANINDNKTDKDYEWMYYAPAINFTCFGMSCSPSNSVYIEDVKEFVKRLKDWVYKMDFEEGYFCGEEGERMRNEIDKLAGERLIEEKKQ